MFEPVRAVRVFSRFVTHRAHRPARAKVGFVPVGGILLVGALTPLAACGDSGQDAWQPPVASDAGALGMDSPSGSSGGDSGRPPPDGSLPPDASPDEVGADTGASDTGGPGIDSGPPPPQWVNLDSSQTQNAPANGPVGGRVIAIRVDPRNADVVYSGSANGGLWKSTDFTGATAHWTPITDGAAMTAIGSVDLDPQSPDTVYVALGGYDYNELPDASMMKSGDGGSTWSWPVPLPHASVVRDVRVDPKNSSIVMVASDAGLYRSTDAGATYAQVDFPNVGGANVSETVWSLAYVGAGSGGTVWVASGQCNSSCTGDLWRSVDSGATWSSLRSSNAFPVSGDVHGMTAAAGAPNDPTTTAVYVLADGGSGVTVLYRSTDGGQTYVALSGALTNPGDSCNSVADTMGGQGWFNQAIAVDPADSNHVIFAGQLCSVRSLDGLSASPTFSRASDWLDGNSTAPYVHADWHALLVTSIGGTVRTYSGNDGGFFSSTNLWSTPAGSEHSIVWRNDNAGMDTQLADSMACGDPTLGNDGVVMSGLADNGTNFGVQSTSSWTFYQALGGDGAGSAVDKGTAGEFFWGGVARGDWIGCSGTAAHCTQGNWDTHNPNYPAGDSASFGRWAAVYTDPSGGVFLGASTHNVWRSDASMNWTAITGNHCDTNNQCNTGNFGGSTTRVFASQTIAGLYGVGFDDGTAAVTSNGTGATPDWTVSTKVPISGGVENVAFPASVPAGTTAGDVYVVVVDTSDTPSQGHIFQTMDRGKTWSSLAGSGAGGLPNVGIRTARFDPSDTTNQTIYAGTHLGVYRTTDGGNTWSRYGAGLPNVIVADLHVALDGSLVRAGTRGRGIWEIHAR